MILAELPERKNCGCFFKKHNRHEQVKFSDKYRGFFSCLHLAVGRHHRRRILRNPHGLFDKPVLPSLARRNPTEMQFFTIATAFLLSLSLLSWEQKPLAFCLVVHQPYDAGTNTIPRLYIPSREDANIHKAIACKYLSRSICMVVEESYQGYFCL